MQTTRKPDLSYAAQLLKRGVSLIPFEILEDGKKKPWDSWTVDRLPVQTEQQLLGAASQPHCHGFQFRAIDAGWCVVDIDIKSGKDGLQSLQAEAAKRGVILDPKIVSSGFVVRTPNNGFHVYFMADDFTRTYSDKGIIEGIDILCDRSSLVVVPGSLGVDKAFNWFEYRSIGSFNTVPEMPTELSMMFWNVRKEHEEAKNAEQELKRLEAEARRTMNYEGGSLFDEAKSRVNTSLIEAWFSVHGSHWKGNEYWTLNPMRSDNHIGSFSIKSDGSWYEHSTQSGGGFIDLAMSKFGMTNYEAACYIIESTGGNPDDYKGHPVDIIQADWDSILEHAKKNAQTVVDDEEEPGDPTPCDKLKITFADELPTSYQAPDEIIQGLVESKAVSVIYGDSNSGKTFFALSLAGGVAEGVDVYGRKVDQGIVVYLATEAPGSIRTRIQALQKYYKKRFSNIAIVPVPLNFYESSGDAVNVLRAIRQIEEERGPVKLIIADTLARMSAGANENSGEDMGPVMERFSSLVSQTDAALIIIHHSGKDAAKGARGWSGIRAHIDTEIEVTENDKLHSAEITKQRNLNSKNQIIGFKLEVIDMGIGKFGDLASTCVAIPSDHTPKKESDQTKKDKSILTEAWLKSEKKVDSEGNPYLEKEDLINYFSLTTIGTRDSILTNLKTSQKNRFGGRIIETGTCKVHEKGFSVIDQTLTIQMFALASVHNGTQHRYMGT